MSGGGTLGCGRAGPVAWTREPTGHAGSRRILGVSTPLQASTNAPPLTRLFCSVSLLPLHTTEAAHRATSSSMNSMTRLSVVPLRTKT